jgi:hypothetical protein
MKNDLDPARGVLFWVAVMFLTYSTALILMLWILS